MQQLLVFKSIKKNLKKEGKTIFYSSHILEVVEKQRQNTPYK